ncbi:MAG TPA: serine hydrolase [Gemmatimonadaceae bacterium]|nr:serine hydrolase [Gemmatimonadaceae bacterium]
MRLSTIALLAFAPVALVNAQGTLIVNARVIDGTGTPARPAEVRIVGGKIEAIGHWARNPADRVIDAHGLTLAPGFIDTHSHHDRGLNEHRDALAVVSQGVTTIVAGQDGWSDFPLASFFSRLDSQPAAINVASYVGHGMLRSRVMGDDYRRVATDAEVARMRDLLREEMAAGALGLSTGLEYDPGIFSSHNEVLALAKVAASAGGRYISHIRSEDREFWQALGELIDIGRVTHMPVQVSHMKLAMRALWGQGPRLIATLDSARRAGINVTADVYPWTMWQSTLTVLYPKRNFSDSAETRFVLSQVAAPEDLVIGDYALNRAYEGKNLAQIAAMRGSDPATTLMALIAESQGARADESVVARGMDERDIATIMRWPFTNFCSDGELDGAHPRGFGSFTRVLGKYVRDEHVLTLEDAVRRMTTLAAANVGITDRGRILPGMAADLVLFDPNTVGDRATLADPHALSTGINTVWVNGEIVYEKGRTTGRFPGRVIRRANTPVLQAGAARAPEDSIDAFVRAEMARQKVPGVAVGIVNHGEVTARGYGYANVEHMVPVTEETIFQSGSLGKMFTATGVMLLVEDGKISLTDPLTKYFPDAPATWRNITVRHLLTHTSGIPDYTTDTFDYRRDYTEDQLAHLAYAMPLEFPAGSRWNYSNTGYALLGFIIHKASGQFYGDLLRDRVFTPLGMTTTRIISEADIVPNRAAGYQLVNGELKNQDWVAPQLNTTADGSLYFSLRDLLVWNAAVKRRAILKPESWNFILTPVRLNSGNNYPYGFGWFLDSRNGHTLQEHSGSWQGFKTQLSRFIDDDLSIIVLANLAEAQPSRFADGIAGILNPALAIKPLSAISDTEPAIATRATQLLDAARSGRLTPAEFAYVRAGFFPGANDYYRKLLTDLGPVSRMQLVDRRTVGDDRIYTYELTFATGKRDLRLALAPDGRIADFAITAAR